VSAQTASIAHAADRLDHAFEGFVANPEVRPDVGRDEAIKEVEAVLEVAARDRYFRRMLAWGDVIAMLAALALSVTILGDDQIHPLMLLGVPMIVVVAKIIGLYDRDELLIRKSTLDEAPLLFQLATMFTLLAWLADDALIFGTLGKTQVLFLWFALFTLVFLCRVIVRRAGLARTATERCVFIGDAGAYHRLRAKLERQESTVLVGRMSLQRIARRGHRGASTQDLNELIRWTGAHRIIIESQALPAEEMHDLVRAAKGVGVRVSVLPQVLDVVGTSVVFDELEGMTILGVRRFGLTRSSQLLKRSFDLAGATIGLLAIAPLMLALAIAIKLDSRGPILFRQTRVGRDGRRFRICKFRTMVVDAEERKAELQDRNECVGGMFKIADDPRVTRVGRFLRKTSLDELPQLFNVFGGDMSLVGPRPLIDNEDDKITGYDRHRLALTPGMTGHWQILGSSRVPLHEMVKIDYLYVAGWSLWADLKILLRTVPYMLARRGM
jgi:exopolysaccharide biosynthesis polyprenyl glycosylphosphotransferase